VLFEENFDDNTLNDTFWVVNQHEGPLCSEINGRWEVVIPGESWDNDLSDGDQMRCRLDALEGLSGDFDIQVDFHLLQWPDSSGVRVGIRTYVGNVTRVGFGIGGDFFGLPRENFVSNLGRIGSGLELVETELTDGTLRLIRIGNTVRTYYSGLGTEDWTLIGGYTTPDMPSEPLFGLAVWTHNAYFAQEDVRVAFDNLVVRTRSN